MTHNFKWLQKNSYSPVEHVFQIQTYLLSLFNENAFILILIAWGSTLDVRLWILRNSIDFRRQNLTSVDVRFWRLMSIPHWKSKHIYNDRIHNIGIQMNQKEQISHLFIRHLWWFQIEKNPLFSMVYTTICQRLKGEYWWCIWLTLSSWRCCRRYTGSVDTPLKTAGEKDKQCYSNSFHLLLIF